MRAHIFISLAALVAPSARADDAPPDLGAETTLEVVLRLALARNPDLAEQRARVAGAQARTAQAGRLPDLQLKYEQWGVPLERPLALREANALMVGVTQTFPAPGTLSARQRLAQQETASAAASEVIRRRELRAQVRRTFADYYRADRETKLHREHVELTARLVELSRNSYRSGQRTQQDVLRLSLELSRLHRDLAQIQQERISAQALLNALMNRPVDAPLGPPAELQPEAQAAAATPDDRSLDQRRPEISAAAASIQRSEAELDLARSDRMWPSVTLGADYMYMPTMEHPHGYGAMVMLNLPWLSPARADAVRAAESSLTADRHALQSVRNAVQYEVREARARHEAARATFAIIEQDLQPQARRNFEAAYASYAAGQGDAIALIDALRSSLEVGLDRVRSLARLASAAADLARAAGEKEDRP